MKETELKPCECVIGEWLDFDDTQFVTEKELGALVEETNRYVNDKYILVRFRFCPECGRKIDWKAIKRRATDERPREAD